MKHTLYIFSALLLLAACVPQNNTPNAKAKRAAPAASLIAEDATKVPSIGRISDDIPQVKVAFLVPLSGESAEIGKSMMDAASLALYDSYLTVPSDEIRAQIVLVPKDTGATSTETAKAASAAIQQGASFIVGPLFSQSVSAVAPVAKEKNISLISFSNNKAVAAAGVYTFGFMPEQQVERIAEYAYLNKYQRVAVLAPNDAYGEKVRESLSEIYLRKGGIVSPSELYAPSAANIDAAVARIAGAFNNTPEDRRFQAIFVADSGNQMRNIVKALTKNNIDLKKIKLIGTGLWDDKELTKIPEMQGAWFPSSSPEPYEKFENRFENTYGYKPVRLASLAYDAVALTASAAMSGKPISNAALTDAKGFISPANGLMRLLPSGKSDRKLTIMEVTPDGFKVIDRAPTNFSPTGQ